MLSVEAAAHRFTDRDYHPTALVRLAAHYLTRQEPAVAFMFADRRCRISPRAGAQDYALRALCFNALGNHQAAKRDFTRAHELDPTDAQVNKSILDAGFADSPIELARNIIASPRADYSAIETALQVFWRETHQAVIRISFQSNMLRGWVVWRGGESMTLRLKSPNGGDDDRPEELIFQNDPRHRLSKDSSRATDFAIEIERERCASVEVADPGGSLPRSFIYIDAPLSSSFPRTRGYAEPMPETDLCNIIVPLYDDIEITQLCLEQLKQQKASTQINCILVNDHPGHLELQALAAQAETSSSNFRVINNPVNLGFAGSINKALEQIESGDVLLLNSDTILPIEAVERLRKAAYSAGDIGTVTPLTNNGELTSIPAAFKENPLRSIEDIEAINETLAQANAGMVVTLPTGIGFCLYIKRTALNVISRLPDYYGRGYYEDVDFCLKLRAAGFRNVCATDVYIGHKGSASFAVSKRALVVRNLRVLTSRFPHHSVESAAFVKADPLAATRALLAYTHPEKIDDGILLFGASSSLKAERTAWLSSQGKTVFHLDRTPNGAGGFCLRCADQETWAIEFASDSCGFAKLSSFLQRAHITRIEMSAVAACTNELMNFILDEHVDATLLFDAVQIKTQNTYHHPCLTHDEGQPCARCREDFSKRMHVAITRKPFAAMSIRSRGIRTVVTNRMAEAIARKFRIEAAPEFSSAAPRIGPRSAKETRNVLGILNFNTPVETEPLLLTMIQYIACMRLDIRLVVVGNALDELRLMSAGNAFVTGVAKPDESSELLMNYQIGALFFPRRWEGFGLVDRLSEETGCPQAYFDWSFGAMSRRQNDLSMDPRICDEAAGRKVVAWVQRLFLQ